MESAESPTPHRRTPPAQAIFPLPMEAETGSEECTKWWFTDKLKWFSPTPTFTPLPATYVPCSFFYFQQKRSMISYRENLPSRVLGSFLGQMKIFSEKDPVSSVISPTYSSSPPLLSSPVSPPRASISPCIPSIPHHQYPPSSLCCLLPGTYQWVSALWGHPMGLPTHGAHLWNQYFWQRHGMDIS